MFGKNKTINNTEIRPKYSIGDKVFYLEYSKVKTGTVFGIFQKEGVKFYYFTEEKPSIETYGWISEKDLFISKEELIKSL